MATHLRVLLDGLQVLQVVSPTVIFFSDNRGRLHAPRKLCLKIHILINGAKVKTQE